MRAFILVVFTGIAIIAVAYLLAQHEQYGVATSKTWEQRQVEENQRALDFARQHSCPLIYKSGGDRHYNPQTGQVDVSQRRDLYECSDGTLVGVDLYNGVK